MSLRVLADENIPAVEHYIGKLGSVQRFSGRDLDPAQLAGIDVLLVRSVTVVDEALLAGSDLRFVGTATSGYDHIDRLYLAQREIGFAHAPGSNANSVVEYVLCAIAAVGGHLERLLDGGRVGIVGYGVIGKALAARLRALNISYRVYDPWLGPEGIENRGEFTDILACEVVTLHPELTREQPWPSYHLFDEVALRRLGDDHLFINASRGAVVDNAALLARLGAPGAMDVVLDVWEGEPAISRALLDRVDIGTPHIAGYSLDGKMLATRMLCEAMASHLELPWRAPGNPAGEVQALALSGQLEGAALLRDLLACRYDISRDDAALRAACRAGDDAGAAAAFDELRRNYPERRELLGNPVMASGATSQALQLIRGLGCVAVEAGRAQ